MFFGGLCKSRREKLVEELFLVLFRDMAWMRVFSLSAVGYEFCARVDGKIC